MPVRREQLDAALNPRVVAVVGARKVDNYTWLRNMETFKGKVYSVQIDPNDIAGIVEMGVPNYKSLVDIPEPVDYAVFAVPRRATPFVLKDAIAKGVKTVHFFTSGFAETATDDGRQLSAQIAQMANEAGMLIIGPNCMGVYNPENGMRFGQNQTVGSSGPVTVLSQSGAHASSLVSGVQASGVGVNKGISFGNGMILDSPDLVEYFAQDPKTEIIAIYVEGPKDARRLFEALRRTTPRKPVVLWKGGQTPAGSRMASSHTGSLAGSIQIWDAVFRQTGAIRADTLEETLDMVKALAYLKPTTGDGVGVIGGSGGQSVAVSDDFNRAGLRIPTFSPHTLEVMGSFFQLVGASYFNPVDVGGINRGNLETIIDLMTTDPNIDAIALQVGVLGAAAGRRTKEDVLAELQVYQKASEKTGKPVAAVLWAPAPFHNGAALEETDKILQSVGIPAFPSPARAARSLKKVIDYYRFRQGLEDGGR